MSPNRVRKFLPVLALTFVTFLILISFTDFTRIEEEENSAVFERRFSRFLDSVKEEVVTEEPRKLELDDIYIAVKTSEKYHEKRLKVVMDTWAKIAKRQTHFFSDATDSRLHRLTDGRFINTNCSSGHSRRALCCKMGVELDYFLKSDKKWFCHTDDDVYVNVRRLVRVLRRYDVNQDWYLGKPSLSNPISMETGQKSGPDKFWFATGGAAFCLSRQLVLKMATLAGGRNLLHICEKIKLPDDCSVGYVINHLLKVDLTVIKEFHSHLESLRRINNKNLHKQVTLSYSPGLGGRQDMNLVDVAGFDAKSDPTRFYSVHCRLYTYLDQCKALKR